MKKKKMFTTAHSLKYFIFMLLFFYPLQKKKTLLDDPHLSFAFRYQISTFKRYPFEITVQTIMDNEIHAEHRFRRSARGAFANRPRHRPPRFGSARAANIQQESVRRVKETEAHHWPNSRLIKNG